MVVNPFQKACLLTVLACLLATPVQADEANPENEPESESPSEGTWPPCDFIYIDTEAPYVDPHPECITTPTFP